ncbi:MAG: DUF2851 family protein [Dehalococcoidia bacterium]
MTTRNRINICEKEVALIWQQVVAKKLTSWEGEVLRVVYPGRPNGDDGPDFRDAVIVNKSQLKKGDVETHVRSSDWYSHGHHADAGYNSVILHVVLWYDGGSPTLLQSGQLIPTLCLSQALQHQAYLLPGHLPCFQIGERLGKHSLEKLLEVAGEERFKQKVRGFQAKLEREEAGEVLFRGMMRAMGYAKNTQPFEELARRMPLSSLESTESLAQKQALLLGTAGLLPSQRGRGMFAPEEDVGELERIWRSANAKIEPMKDSDWNLSRIYPNNTPVRRLIAVSYLLQRYCEQEPLREIFQLLKKAAVSQGYPKLENSLTVSSHGYWLYHFDFGITSRKKIPALLGKSKVGEILVNVILPFAFSWGSLANEAKLADKAMELYRNYPRLAENCLTRHMAKQLCLEGFCDFRVCHQQGLIHIFRNYCREGRCSECPLAG